MNQLPQEIKLTYIIAIIVMLLFVGFIILVVFVYNKKQLIQQQENQIKESEFKNQLLQKELERQKAIQLERERISQDMHDDLGAGISAIKLQAEFLKHKSSNVELQEDIEQIIKTSEEMNLSLREILWSLNNNNDTIGNFLRYTTSYVDGFLKRTDIAFDFQTIAITNNLSLPAKARRNLFLVVKEAINNVYKYSQATTLSIRFSQDETNLNIIITDDGIGIKQADRQKGNGLDNMAIRMKAIEGKCKIRPVTKGTCIALTYPLTKQP
jgi:two-component system, NarL family, sensor histidine kinase DesK